MKKYKKIDKTLLILIYILLGIPAILFIIFWTKWYISIPTVLLIVYLIYKSIKCFKYKSFEEYKSIFNIKKWIIILVILLVLNIFSGSGGFMYQNWDYNARNAVLHDLIDYKWPVKYHYSDTDLIYNIVGENGQLSYYFSYWLIGASIGKISNFYVASIVMFIYQYMLLALFYYLLCRLFNKNNIWYLLIIICFSGLDILGSYFLNPNYNFTLGSHIDVWGSSFAYSSNITQLFWVFNQALPAWILTLLFLNNKSFKNIGIIITLSLLFSPFPTIGFIFIIFYYFILGFKKENFKIRFKEAFSKENFLAIIPFLLIGLFYLNNANAQPKGLILSQGVSIKIMLIVMLFEFILLSLICLNKQNWKYILMNTICIFICSQFFWGTGRDFVNRTTIPLLLMLLIYSIDNIMNNKNKIKNTMIIVYFTLSSITPLSEIYRTYDYYKQYGILAKENYSDNWKTYGKTLHEDAMRTYIKNFSSPIKDNFLNKYIYR